MMDILNKTGTFFKFLVNIFNLHPKNKTYYKCERT